MTSKDLVLVYIAYYIKNAIYLELNINVKSWPKKTIFPNSIIESAQQHILTNTSIHTYAHTKICSLFLFSTKRN